MAVAPISALTNKVELLTVAVPAITTWMSQGNHAKSTHHATTISIS